MRATERPSRPATAELRTALLDAALAELDEVGLDRASMRSVARRVGISHQGITHHFTDRSVLFTALATQSWTLLGERFRTALADLVDDDGHDFPGRPVITVGRTYIGFARQNPSRFAVMFADGLLDRSDPALGDSMLAVWELHRRTVEQENARGWGGDAAPRELALATFSLAHGLADLEDGMPALLPRGLGEDVLLMVNQAIIR